MSNVKLLSLTTLFAILVVFAFQFVTKQLGSSFIQRVAAAVLLVAIVAVVTHLVTRERR